MKTSQAIKIIDTLREVTKQGTRFMSFLYTTKGTEETSIYNINFGISYKTAVESDLAAVEAKDVSTIEIPEDLKLKGVTTELLQEAKEKIILSATQNLTEGVSESYTQKDTFESIGKGIRIHKDTDQIYIYGFVQSKTQVAEAKNPKKPVNSKPSTLAKALVEKACDFKRNKFKQFILNPENIAGIKVSGEIIEVQN